MHDAKNAPQKGTVTSQGVAAHGAANWHASGYTGDGVKVGIIDLGFTGFSDLLGGELPAAADITARCYTEIGTHSATLANCESETNHGTIVAESLLDIAPDATLYISNPVSLGDLKDTVDWMVEQDVDIINHSVSRAPWDGPGDGTSPFANSALKSVDAAVTGGIIFVNSAGNYARATWYGSFPTGASRLIFQGANFINTIPIGAGKSVTFQLRWDDSWTAADTSLELQLYRRNARGGWDHVLTSDNAQTGEAGHIPRETIGVKVNVAGTYGLTVRKMSGDTPSWAQLQALGGNLAYSTASRSMGNPAESANAGMLSVGATHYWDTNTIASYSSQGPTPGGATKPDITGAACAQVSAGSVTAGFSGPDGQQCWFAGTSQSAPHVAGLAALVKERFPDYTPAQIATYLKTNALDRGANSPNNI